MKHGFKIFAWLAAIFAGVYFMPVGATCFDTAVFEALELAKWYAREHDIPCLLPAFWITGAIAAFSSKESVMKYLGPGAEWIANQVGGNPVAANFCASLSGVPIIQGLLGSGMRKGAALGLLLAGPALSLPGMLVISPIIGPRKTTVDVTLVVVMATFTGRGLYLIARQWWG